MRRGARSIRTRDASRRRLALGSGPFACERPRGLSSSLGAVRAAARAWLREAAGLRPGMFVGDDATGCRRRGTPLGKRRREMILATTKVEDFDRFVKIFRRKGLRSEAARFQGFDRLSGSE